MRKKNQYMESLGRGTVMGEKCNLTNTLFVPDLTKNLLSVPSITEHNGAVLFTKEGVKVLKSDMTVPHESVILEGYKTERGLFMVDLRTERNTVLLTEEKHDSTMMWHRKMGHIGMQNLKQLPKLCTGININVSEEELRKICEVCVLAKQKKLPHKKIRERGSEPLRLIHTDVCGPITPPTHDNKRYFVTFLDDYTHFCVVFLMQHKYEVFPLLKKYILEAENFMNKKVYKIRCDNGGEYKDTDCEMWCSQRGTVIDFQVPYCHELCGKAERLNLTIEERARALLFDFGR